MAQAGRIEASLSRPRIGSLASVCSFDQSGEQYGIDAALTCRYKGYALYQRQQKMLGT
jgi:hypothetical protein